VLKKARKVLEKRSARQKIGNMLFSGAPFATLIPLIQRYDTRFDAKLRRSHDS